MTTGPAGPASEDPGQPVWADLASPRAPSTDELRLLVALAAAVDEPLLHRQGETATVVGVCRCGCSSVRLASAGPVLPEARVAELSPRGDPHVLSVESSCRRPGAGPVQVVLHVLGGRLHELEVFADEGVAVPLAGLTVRARQARLQ